MFKAVIFDFDGVIWNSPDIYLDIRKKYLKDNYNVSLKKEDLALNLATPTKEFVEYINKKYKLSLDLEKYKKVKFKMFKEKASILKINLGVLDLLKDLKKNNIKIALSSSNEKVVIIKYLTKLKIIKYFDEIISSEDVKRHKPFPDCFIKASKKLKIFPKDCIAFEDAPLGVKAINSAKMFSIAIITKFTNKKTFKDFNPNLIINSLKNINYFKLVEIYEKSNFKNKK